VLGYENKRWAGSVRRKSRLFGKIKIDCTENEEEKLQNKKMSINFGQIAKE
jgi:hypothetical protein